MRVRVKEEKEERKKKGRCQSFIVEGLFPFVQKNLSSPFLLARAKEKRLSMLTDTNSSRLYTYVLPARLNFFPDAVQPPFPSQTVTVSTSASSYSLPGP